MVKLCTLSQSFPTTLQLALIADSDVLTQCVFPSGFYVMAPMTVVITRMKRSFVVSVCRIHTNQKDKCIEQYDLPVLEA